MFPRQTRTTTKTALGPLSGARGQKRLIAYALVEQQNNDSVKGMEKMFYCSKKK